jgi:hypothetical protein
MSVYARTGAIDLMWPVNLRDAMTAFDEIAVAESNPGGMTWEDLLTEFRELGGIADNVIIRKGPMGRGVFPIDPEKPIRLRTPSNLLVPSADTELRAGKLIVGTSASLGQRERIFFERYQEYFSWGAGTLNELWQEQRAWSELPEKVRETLKDIGPTDADRFAEPSADLCLRRYLATRQSSYRGTLVLMPVVELINHRDQTVQLDRADGIGIEGKYEDEVVFDYGPDDCWGMAMTYGFCAARRWAHSLETKFTFEGLDISISRLFGRVERYNDVPVPMVDINGNKVTFSFLILGHVRFPRIPRAVFSHVAKSAPIRRPDELFDVLQHHNRMKFLGFLRAADGLSSPLATMLRSAAYQQLETLSAHFGTRSLEKNV